MVMDNKFNDPKYFDNRELSWLKFERRVLNEAKVEEIPILERLKFIAITSSNLDEFFMVRVASLKDMEHADYKKKDFSGLTPTEQLERIAQNTHALVEDQYAIYQQSLSQILKNEGIEIIQKHEELNEEQAEFVKEYFMSQVYPVLTPMAVDASRPFPLIRNKSLNIAALLKAKNTNSRMVQTKEDELEFSTVQVPNVLPRFIEIPVNPGVEHTFILLEQIIEMNIQKLYLNYDVVCAYPYRIMRNADLSFDEDEAADLLKEIQKQLARRQWGEVIRLEIEANADERLLGELAKQLQVKRDDIYEINGPIDFTFFMKLYGIEGYAHLRQEPFEPQKNPRISGDESIFDEIKKGDILLFHPYETFDPVVDFIKQAAMDPNVLAIKQTLYRVSGNSPIIAALALAANHGKQVTVLVELKARFDEENNIVWAKKLEQAGCHVIYGLVGLKTHCKIALVVRQEDNEIKRYVHLGTGNYNDSTARLYTDCGMFTCAHSYGEDATALFNMLSGYSEPAGWNKLVVAPIWLRKRFVALIQREMQHAKEGKKANIVAKMNSLCDQEIIENLYEASQAGVEIHLIVRGICCLRTNQPDISENIHVTSIVGTYLEHSRIFYFYNDGAEDIYMGSADWMPRNMDRRVEILFPIEDVDIKAKAKHMLEVLLHDNVKAYSLQADGNYVRKSNASDDRCNAQEYFCMEAMQNVPEQDHEVRRKTFIPIWALDSKKDEN